GPPAGRATRTPSRGDPPRARSPLTRTEGEPRCPSRSERRRGRSRAIAGPTGRRAPRPPRSAPSAARPSPRTWSAGTAATTPAARWSRSSERVTRSVPLRRTALEKALGVRFGNEEVYARAFVHRSYAYENGGLPTNERLEFLGDAVLGLVITDMIYRAFPNLTEGQLAKLRAATVNMNVLADVARELGIGDVVRLGHGEQLSGGRDKSSILADTLEALLGAVYLDRGLARAAKGLRRAFA